MSKNIMIQFLSFSLFMSILFIATGFSTEPEFIDPLFPPGNNYEQTMSKEFFFLKNVPSFSMNYEVIVTLHQPKKVVEGMYNPNLPEEQIARWKEAQKGKRSQLEKRNLIVKDNLCVWTSEVEAGPIHPDYKLYRFTLDFAKGEGQIYGIKPHQAPNTKPIHNMIFNHEAHFLMSPAQLFGIDKQPCFIAEENMTEMASKSAGVRKVYIDNDKGDIVKIVDKHPELDRVDSAMYRFNSLHVSVIEYSDYTMNEVLGLEIPKKISTKKYSCKSIADRNDENLIVSQDITITKIERMD